MCCGADEDVSKTNEGLKFSEMKFYEFEFINDTIHILDYPTADKVLELPNDHIVKRLKDMCLHWHDLTEAKLCLEAIDDTNSALVNRALAQNAIVVFYKCFGTSKFRNNSLNRDKILARLPSGAKDVFDYYKNIRDKFIVHDESRHAQVITGLILETAKTPPFVDTVNTVAVTEMFATENQLQGLRSFHHLVTVAILWTENTIDELSDEIKKTYQSKPLSFFDNFSPLKLNAPTEEELFQKRY